MIDADKVVRGLKACCKPGGGCGKCPYRRTDEPCDTILQLMRDALSLIRELRKAPRILTTGEIRKYSRTDRPVWMEQRYPVGRWDGGAKGHWTGAIFVAAEYLRPRQGYYKPEEYGKTWRCWSERPDDAARAGAAWDETEE